MALPEGGVVHTDPLLDNFVWCEEVVAFDFELSIRRMGMHVRRWLCLLFGAANAPGEQAVERRRRAGIRERVKRNSGGSLLAGRSFYQEAYVMFHKAYKSSRKGIRSRVRWMDAHSIRG